MNKKWARVRFKGNLDDSRPVKFPPPGPYWESGYDDTHSTIVAYFPIGHEDRLKEFWPEAEQIDWLGTYECLEFSERFPKPSWWKEE